MLKNIIKIGIRNLTRNKVFSVLNILGLAIGLTASILILLYAHHEKSYDRFHEDAEHIHRVTMSFRNGDDYTTTTTSPWRIAPLMKESFSGISDYLRMFYAFNSKLEVVDNERHFDITDNYTYVDPNFFEFFSFELLVGNPTSVFKDPGTIVITKSEAIKIFGTTDIIGEIVTLRNVYENSNSEYKITGVMDDIPSESHFHYNYYMSLVTLENTAPNMTESWGWTSVNSYVKLFPEIDIDDINQGLKEMISSNAPEWYQEWAFLGTQPITDIHLYSNLKEEIESNGIGAYIQLLIIIAIFIIAIACINYMNLATSMASKRSKEVGVKKTLGADKKQLIQQFLIESVLTILIASVLAITLVQVFLPIFNEFSHRSFSLLDLPSSYFLGGFLLLIVLGIISGSYPAFFLSSFNPLRVLGSSYYKMGNGSVLLRKGLVIVQFAISSFLICATLIILNQWDFLRNKALGLETEQIISVELPSARSRENYDLFRTEVLKESDVIQASACSKSPTGRYDGFGGAVLKGETFTMPMEYVDEYFFETFDIEIVEGRNLDPRLESDSNSVVLNQKAVEFLGLDNVLGTQFIWYNAPVKVVGVVEDFHFEPLYTELGPVVFFLGNDYTKNFAYVKINTSDMSNTLSKVENHFKEINPGEMYAAQFVSDELENAYHSEKQFFWIFTTFSSLAIFIACLGLFGLASFTITQRMKEIGIRKTLGASSGSIAILFSRNFMILVLISNIIAWPMAYWIMNGWLERFPYRISIGFGVFLITGILSIVIALLSVSSNSIKASLVNPVKSLRYE